MHLDRGRPYGTLLPPAGRICFEQDGRHFAADGSEVSASAPAAPSIDQFPAVLEPLLAETPVAPPKNKGGRPRKNPLPV